MSNATVQQMAAMIAAWVSGDGDVSVAARDLADVLEELGHPDEASHVRERRVIARHDLPDTPSLDPDTQGMVGQIGYCVIRIDDVAGVASGKALRCLRHRSALLNGTITAGVYRRPTTSLQIVARERFGLHGDYALDANRRVGRHAATRDHMLEAIAYGESSGDWSFAAIHAARDEYETLLPCWGDGMTKEQAAVALIKAERRQACAT